MLISDCMSDVFSSDLLVLALLIVAAKPLDEREETLRLAQHDAGVAEIDLTLRAVGVGKLDDLLDAPFLIEDDAPVSGRVGWPEGEADEVGSVRRSEEHTSELQSLMRISYAVFRLKQKK